MIHLRRAKPRKDYEVGFVLVAVRVFVPPTRPGKNCPVESGDAYRYATVVSYPDLSCPTLSDPNLPINSRENQREEGREGESMEGVEKEREETFREALSQADDSITQKNAM